MPRPPRILCWRLDGQSKSLLPREQPRRAQRGQRKSFTIETNRDCLQLRIQCCCVRWELSIRPPCTAPVIRPLCAGPTTAGGGCGRRTGRSPQPLCAEPTASVGGASHSLCALCTKATRHCWRRGGQAGSRGPARILGLLCRTRLADSGTLSLSTTRELSCTLAICKRQGQRENGSNPECDCVV